MAALDTSTSSQSAVGHRGFTEQMPTITGDISHMGMGEEHGQSMMQIEKAKLEELKLSFEKKKSAGDAKSASHTANVEEGRQIAGSSMMVEILVLESPAQIMLTFMPALAAW